ncbi:MAG: hypothetical protein FWH50_00910 [Coriobacteriia bacterium]|nr:hypothetical protein [Coriobacteriia bacterium]
MKKLIALFVVLVLTLSTTACFKTDGDDPTGNDIDQLGQGTGVDDTPQSGDGSGSGSGSGSGDSTGNGAGDEGQPFLSGPELEEFHAAFLALPGADAIDTVWQRLDGYWTGSDELYVGFTRQNGKFYFIYGVWEVSGHGYGELVGAVSKGETAAVLIIHYPAIPASEITGAQPEMDIEVAVDASAYAQDGTIAFQIMFQGDGDWHDYSFGGVDYVSAYESAH